MKTLVEEDIPFEKYEYEVEDALDILRNIGAWDRYYLLKYSDKLKIFIYNELNLMKIKHFSTIHIDGAIMINTGLKHQLKLLIYLL